MSILREDAYLVIEQGSFATRCGLGISDPNKLPSQVIPTQVGELAAETDTADSAASKVKYACGDTALHKPDRLKSAATCPLRDNHVADWDHLTALWRYIITKRFRLKVPTMDSPVVLAVPTGWSRNELERTAQIFFEQFNVPGIYIAEKPLLAAYGCGVLTGLVIDIGHNFTDITPILDSTVQGHALQRLALAGAHVEERLLEVLRQDSGATSTLGDKLDLSFCRYVKERHFDLTRLNAKGELATNDTKPIELTYQDIKVSLNPRILQTIEVLFSPGLTNQYSLDLLAAIERAILLCDFDKRTALWDSFILTGGLSMMKGFQAHLELRLKSILPCSDNFGDSQVQEVKFIKIPDYFSKFKDRPDYMAYLGATIAAKLVFVDPKNYVNKVDYNETGPAAISSKGV